MKDNITQLNTHPKPRSDDDFLNAAHLMKSGGSFASHIANAYIVADSHNKERLKAAFPDLFTTYYNLILHTENTARIRGGNWETIHISES